MSPRPSMKKFAQKAAKAARKVEQNTPEEKERLGDDSVIMEGNDPQPPKRPDPNPDEKAKPAMKTEVVSASETDSVKTPSPEAASAPIINVKAKPHVQEKTDIVQPPEARAASPAGSKKPARSATAPAPQDGPVADAKARPGLDDAFKLEDSDEFFEEEEASLENRFLTFYLAGEDYGIRVLDIIEIIGMQSITEIPDVPEAVRGLVNLRGHIIPVVDVRMRFELESVEYGERTSIIVVQLDDMRAGLIVDQVKEILDIPEESLSPPSKVTNSKMRHFIESIGRIGDDVKIILNLENLLFPEGRPKAA